MVREPENGNLRRSLDSLPDLVAHKGGILFAPPDDRRVLPTQVNLYGIVYRRFMDRILLPVPTDELTADQVVVVNRLRLKLIEAGHPMTPNVVMKEAVARLIGALGVTSVVEWGPGIDPINDYCSVRSYVGVDLDPDVRMQLARRDIRCVAPDAPGLASLQPPDLVVAIFMFQFPLSHQELLAMRRLAEDGAVIFANVYLLDQESRSNLIGRFKSIGLCCSTRPDLCSLIRRQEFWAIAVRDATPILDLFERLVQDVATSHR